MRCLTNEPLYVDPTLVGVRLGSPMRRLVAFAVDALLLVLPTLAVAIGAALVNLEATDPRAVRAIFSLLERQKTGAEHREAMRDLIPLLVRTEARGLPAKVTAAAEEGDLNRAAELMEGYNISFGLHFAEGGSEAPLPPRTVMLEIANLIPFGVRTIAMLGVPALYFVLFARSRRGATIGKWLMGIRVIRLDGERLSRVEALERFVGYAHIPGTFFLSLADLWRDPNRRLPHDRVVHTAVFRMPRRAPSPSGRHAAAGGKRV